MTCTVQLPVTYRKIPHTGDCSQVLAVCKCKTQLLDCLFKLSPYAEISAPQCPECMATY